MKILHVITNLQTGGAEMLMVTLLPLLNKNDCNIELLVFDGTHTQLYSRIEQTGIKIHNLGFIKNVYNPIYIIKLYFFLKKNKYDIIHTHNTAPQLFCAIIKYILNIKLCTTEHNTYNRRRAIWWYKPIDKWMYSKYKKIICISDTAEKNLKKYLHGNYNICTIYNGINVKDFSSASPYTNLRQGKCILIMVARFCPQKDQDTCIQALALLPENKYEFWFVGTGERLPIIKNLCKELHVEKSVQFWGERMDVPNLLKTADIVVMSSHWEGLSLSNLEGMAAGKPFIGSDVDGLRDVTYGYGVLFPHQNAKALADIIESLANDSLLYRKIAFQCKNRAKEFDINIMAEKYKNTYYEILNKI